MSKQIDQAPVAPWWASIIIIVGIIIPPLIVIFVAAQFGFAPAIWTAVAVMLVNVGQRTARRHLKGRP
jgi:hypothetical protein